MRHILSLAFLLAVLACAGSASGADTVYKSVGPDGKVVYSDRPPAGARVEKTMTFENLPSSALPASASSYVEQLRRMHARDARSASDAASAARAGVVLYSAKWCGYCRKAKAWLAGQGVAYRDIDIDSPEGMTSFGLAGGGGGIPLLLADGRRVQSFSPAAYDAVFAKRP